jgi:hypothetical protein
MTEVVYGGQVYRGPLTLSTGLTVAQDADGRTVLTAAGPGGGVTSIIAGTGISVDQATGDVTISLAAHTHTKSQITDFAHTHVKAEITDFAHTHLKADITDFAHTHLKADITDFAHTHLKADLPAAVAYEDEANVFTQTQSVTGTYLTHKTRLLSTDGTEANYKWQESLATDNWQLWSRGYATAAALEFNYTTAMASFGRHIILQSGNVLYFDGGTNSYITESAADRIALVAGGTSIALFGPSDITFATDVVLPAGGKVRLDGASAGDTWIYQSNADEIALVTGGVNGLKVSSAATYVNSLMQAYVAVRARSGTDGWVGLTAGSSANAGYIEWWHHGGSRMGFMGYTASYLNLRLENGFNFTIDGDTTSGNVSIAKNLSVSGELTEQSTRVAKVIISQNSPSGTAPYGTFWVQIP